VTKDSGSMMMTKFPLSSNGMKQKNVVPI
jgi:hypothetical protein